MPKVVEIKSGPHSMMLLPPLPHKCQTCATLHEPHLPHNAQSLYYQMKYKMETGKEPNWKTAMSHCSTEMKKIWLAHLKDIGVDVDAGHITPRKKEKTGVKKPKV